MISDYGPGAFVIVCPPGGNLKKRAISIDTLPASAGGPDGFSPNRVNARSPTIWPTSCIAGRGGAVVADHVARELVKIGARIGPRTGIRWSPHMGSAPNHALRLTLKRRRGRVWGGSRAHPGNVGLKLSDRSWAATTD